MPLIDIAYKGDAFNPKNRSYVAALLLGELAFGGTSELYKRLYIQEQRVDLLQGSIPQNRDVALFEVVARVKKEEDISAIRDEVYKTIATFQTMPVGAQRLADVKKRLKYDFLMDLDTPNKVAGGLAYTIATTGGIEAIDDLYTEIGRVTPDDIINAAKRYFVPERRTVVILKGTHP